VLVVHNIGPSRESSPAPPLLSLALVVVVMPDFNVFAIYKGHVTLTWQCYANIHLVWGHLRHHDMYAITNAASFPYKTYFSEYKFQLTK